jgi:hypothetical protein
MQKRTFYLLGLLIILFFGSSIVLGGDAGVCPVPSPQMQTTLDLPQPEGGSALEQAGSVPRNCVLLELFASTT